MGEALQNFPRVDIDLGQPFDNLANLAGAETRPGKIRPVIGEVVFGQDFQPADGVVVLIRSRGDRKIFSLYLFFKKRGGGVFAWLRGGLRARSRVRLHFGKIR